MMANYSIILDDVNINYRSADKAISASFPDGNIEMDRNLAVRILQLIEHVAHRIPRMYCKRLDGYIDTSWTHIPATTLPADVFTELMAIMRENEELLSAFKAVIDHNILFEIDVTPTTAYFGFVFGHPLSIHYLFSKEDMISIMAEIGMDIDEDGQFWFNDEQLNDILLTDAPIVNKHRHALQLIADLARERAVEHFIADEFVDEYVA